MKKKCVDCGEDKISNRGVRCRMCAGRKNSLGNKNALGHKLSLEVKNKLSLAAKKQWTEGRGVNPPINTGHSKETIERLRQKAIEDWKTKNNKRTRNGFSPNYNKNGCRAIEEYGKKNGYSFQHAENGGEVQIPNTMYFVDGYDKEKNVVIEYMEKFHNQPKNKERDMVRKQEIIKTIGCKFIEVWE